ncbi:MAG: O-antigen ligase family protein [Syntrophomonas sp.]
MNGANFTATNMPQKVLYYLLGVFIIFSPLFEGLFAPVEFLPPLILLLIFSLFYSWRQPVNKKLLFALAALAGVYFLAVLPAVDRGQALVEAYRNLLAVLLFALFLQLSPSRVTGLFRLLFYSGVIAALISLSSLFTGLFLSSSFQGGRLQGVFNYANATAAYMLLAMFLGMFMALKKLRQSNLLIYAGVFLCACALVFSGSRAVWLLWPAAVLPAVLLGADREKKYWAGVMPLLSVLSAGFAAAALFEYESGGPGLTAMIILCGLIVSAAAAYGLQKLLQNKENKLPQTLPLLLLPIFLLLAGGVLYLSQAAPRPISWTVSELQGRLLYYTDALQIIRDYPWLGTGGGGWAVLQYPYQTAMYSVNLVHNHILQLALDTGIIGLLPFIALLVFAGRQWKKALGQHRDGEEQRLLRFSLLAASLLLLHALADIDFSFPPLYAAFMFFLAVPFIIGKEQGHTEAAGEQRCVRSGLYVVKSCTAVFLLGAFIIWTASCLQLRGDRLYNAAQYDAAAIAYQRSVSFLPQLAHTYYLLGRDYEKQALSTGDFNYLNKAAKGYEQACSRSSFNPLYLENLAFVRFYIKDYPGSLDCFHELCRKNPMVLRHYENLAYVLVEAGQHAGKTGSEYFRETLSIPTMLDRSSGRLSSRARYLRDQTDLAVSPRLFWKMGQSAYFLGNTGQAVEFWRAAASDAAVYQEMRRWADNNSIDLGTKL